MDFPKIQNRGVKIGGTRDNKIKNSVFILILLSFALSLHIKLYNYEI